jgi:DNA-binding MarR family transcriptional regulator
VTGSNSHIGQLLRDGFREFEAELAVGLEEPRSRVGLRPVHDAVLAYLDRDGTRASVLAERARLTRQAITQLVDELEELGVVTRRPDPDDGRAKIIEYTPQALEVFDESRKVIAAIEERWKRRLGVRRYAALRSGLEEILSSADGA